MDLGLETFCAEGLEAQGGGRRAVRRGNGARMIGEPQPV